MSATAILVTAIFGGFLGLAIAGWLAHRDERNLMSLAQRVPESPEVADHAWQQLVATVEAGRADFGGAK